MKWQTRVPLGKGPIVLDALCFQMLMEKGVGVVGVRKFDNLMIHVTVMASMDLTIGCKGFGDVHAANAGRVSPPPDPNRWRSASV